VKLTYLLCQDVGYLCPDDALWPSWAFYRLPIAASFSNDRAPGGVDSNMAPMSEFGGVDFEDLRIRSRFLAGESTRARHGVFARRRHMSGRNGVMDVKNVPRRRVVHDIRARGCNKLTVGRLRGAGKNHDQPQSKSVTEPDESLHCNPATGPSSTEIPLRQCRRKAHYSVKRQIVGEVVDIAKWGLLNLSVLV
jgi:hypothetical protein